MKKQYYTVLKVNKAFEALKLNILFAQDYLFHLGVKMP